MMCHVSLSLVTPMPPSLPPSPPALSLSLSLYLWGNVPEYISQNRMFCINAVRFKALQALLPRVCQASCMRGRIVGHQVRANAAGHAAETFQGLSPCHPTGADAGVVAETVVQAPLTTAFWVWHGNASKNRNLQVHLHKESCPILCAIYRVLCKINISNSTAYPVHLWDLIQYAVKIKVGLGLYHSTKITKDSLVLAVLHRRNSCTALCHWDPCLQALRASPMRWQFAQNKSSCGTSGQQIIHESSHIAISIYLYIYIWLMISLQSL